MTVEANKQAHPSGPSRSEGLPAVAILVPVLRRPHNVRPLLDSIRETTKPPFKVLFICDRGDDDEIEAITSAIRRRPASDITWSAPGGTYAAKINHGVRLTSEPLIFTGADDLAFHKGWLEEAYEVLTSRPGVGCVGTNDLCNPRTMAGEHATHFVLARWYAERPTIDGQPGPMCEEYVHEYVDDELIGTAVARHAYEMAIKSEVEHLHPLNGKAEMDPLYAAIPDRMAAGKPIYERRRALWSS